MARGRKGRANAQPSAQSLLQPLLHLQERHRTFEANARCKLMLARQQILESPLYSDFSYQIYQRAYFWEILTARGFSHAPRSCTRGAGALAEEASARPVRKHQLDAQIHRNRRRDHGVHQWRHGGHRRSDQGALVYPCARFHACLYIHFSALSLAAGPRPPLVQALPTVIACSAHHAHHDLQVGLGGARRAPPRRLLNPKT